jgi:ubiquinone/menaquinone biosynthesis C-methylase UbiE
MMAMVTDQKYLRNEQYHDASNLDARLMIHQQFSTNTHGWFPWMFDVLERLPRQAHVLELGCGPAYLWTTCLDRIPDGWDIILSDFSEGMVDAACQNLATSGRNFKFEQIDAQSIPYPDKTFDIVIANHMLYHVPDRPKALTEIRRVMKSGGHLIASTVGGKHLIELDAWLRKVARFDFAPMVANQFTLENGLQQLTPYFSQVYILRYEDSLRVTKLEPLMAYIRSGIRITALSKAGLEKIEANLAQELRTKGEILITKDSGLFEAVK